MNNSNHNLPNQDSPTAARFTVELPTIDPSLPQYCVRCLNPDPSRFRPMTFRRSDKTVERVVAVQWPYCDKCYSVLKPLDRAQFFQGGMIMFQMLLVAYAVGSAMGASFMLSPFGNS